MYKRIVLFFVLILTFISAKNQPLALHPENSHYFIYKSKPTILITSAEHYGAVLNSAFDYDKYLHELNRAGMNYTRIFTGSYVEVPGSFGIQNNTLAPATGKFLAPWKRVNEPGLFEAEEKFDLSQWNPDYFTRLQNFISLANKLDIFVEVTFFCSTYQEANWKRDPLNPGNNINNLPGDLNRRESNTLQNGKLIEFQKELVKKIVTELNTFDNVFYEIQNEPWADNSEKGMRTLRTLDPEQEGWFKWAEKATAASLEWQKEIARTVVETESNLSKKHLIAQNYTNFKHSLAQVDANVSILNFHYVWPEAVWLNYAWNRPVSFDESGFAGSSDTPYLRQAWQFILAGGAVFNNLDYSFFVGREDGTGQNIAPGGGSASLRNQLKILKDFIASFNFVKMAPDFTTVYHSPGAESQCISEQGKQYAVIFTGDELEEVKLNLPKGNYNYQLISPLNGKTLKKGFFKQDKNEKKELSIPPFKEMIALRIVAN
ncbi:hypothetical protein GM418_26935 [Maribellus comscasis]|uniref:Glycoside hydrolase family 5 domain-containing protein n=1 Tax=Maribellus comscasis TaxID=2681766 RepID=A0A6I6K3L6_9BACT|nr:hypothetical protein [Maribellus comscasis]QGY47167.1 hypothetical protein GM418_26935 [Maribellus comscasis]